MLVVFLSELLDKIRQIFVEELICPITALFFKKTILNNLYEVDSGVPISHFTMIIIEENNPVEVLFPFIVGSADLIKGQLLLFINDFQHML